MVQVGYHQRSGRADIGSNSVPVCFGREHWTWRRAILGECVGVGSVCKRWYGDIWFSERFGEGYPAGAKPCGDNRPAVCSGKGCGGRKCYLVSAGDGN